MAAAKGWEFESLYTDYFLYGCSLAWTKATVSKTVIVGSNPTTFANFIDSSEELDTSGYHITRVRCVIWI